MIVDERMVTFIHSLETENSEILETIEKEALDTFVPIIRKEMQSFLKVLLAIKKPKRILEVGTAVGFSAILMSEYAPEDSHITTIEKYEPRIPIAKENFKRAGKEKRITLLEGDALEILQGMKGEFDFIFLDGPKGHYYEYLEYLLPLLSKGGILFADNVLHRGFLSGKVFVPKRHNTIKHSLEKFINRITTEKGLKSQIYELEDGVSITEKL